MTELDYTALDYRCDPRIDADHPNDWISVRHGLPSTWSTFLWVGSGPDGTWLITDEQNNTVRSGYPSAEEAVYSIVGQPILSAYINDTRVLPVDEYGDPTDWSADVTVFNLPDWSAVVYADAGSWVARPAGRLSTTWDLLDGALDECLGPPERPWNAES
jgi:hypothetical protein